MKKPLIGLAVMLVLGLLAFLFMREETDDGGLRKAPAFQLESSSGKRVSLRDFRDQAVVVHFWASWCAPCIPELPEILSAATRLQKDQEGRPVQWVVISIDESWDKAKKILDVTKLPSNVTAVLDPDAKVADLFGTYQYPETYALNREHRVVAKWIGPQDWSGEWGERALTGLEAVSRGQQGEATPPSSPEASPVPAQ